MTPSKATVPRIAGVFFGFTPINTLNGRAHNRTGHIQVRNIHGWCQQRPMMKKVSVGRSPYQITMYCANVRYIQKTEKAKIILPRSCSTLPRVNILPGGNTARILTAVNDIKQRQLQKTVAKYHHPKSVLCHCGDSDDIRS